MRLITSVPSSRKADGGFRLDDEEGVGVGAEFLPGFFEGVGEDGRDDAAVGAADEVEAALLLDELQLAGHSWLVAVAFRDGRLFALTGSIHRIGKRIKGKLE